MTGGASSGSARPTAASGSSAAASGPSEAEKREARKDLNRIDRQLGKIAQQEEKLHVQMAAKSQSGDFDALGELNTKLQELLEEKEGLELEWLEAAEILGE